MNSYMNSGVPRFQMILRVAQAKYLFNLSFFFYQPAPYCTRQGQTSRCQFKFSCKGIQKDNNNITYKKFEDILFNNNNDTATN